MGAYILKENSYHLWKGAMTLKSGQNALESPSPVHFLTKTCKVSSPLKRASWGRAFRRSIFDESAHGVCGSHRPSFPFPFPFPFLFLFLFRRECLARAREGVARRSKGLSRQSVSTAMESGPAILHLQRQSRHFTRREDGP